ncbi:MAG: hypothetical protein LBN39_08015, partial [Planctomycetaceae bacterium]|nr:hypothetical protein [Planctomycetaceae bacterium]
TGSLLKDGDNYDTRHARAGDDIVLTNVISFDVKVWNPYWVPCQVRNSNPAVTFWAAPQFIDLGQDQLPDINGTFGDVLYNDKLDGSGVDVTGIPDKRGYGFTLKGRYNNAATSTGTRRYIDTNLADGVTDEWQLKELSRTGNATGTAPDYNMQYAFMPPAYQYPMPCVFDSWTKDYATDYGYYSPTSDPITPDAQKDIMNWKAPPPYSENLEAIQITIRCFDPASRQIKQVQAVHRFAD